MVRLCRDQATAIYRASWFALLLAMLAATLEPTLAQTPPTVSSATVNATQLTIQFSESLTSSSSAVAADFTVDLGSTAQTVSAASVSGGNVVLTLGSAVPDVECTSDSVTVSYTPTTSSLTGTGGSAVAAFSNQAVTNSTDAPPAITSVATDATGQYIYVTFCEDIYDLSNQWSSFAAFSVVIDGKSRDVNDLIRGSGTPSRLDVLLSGNLIKEGQAVTIDYDKSEGDDNHPLKDLNQGGKKVESWSARMVTNNVDSPPSLVSVTALWDEITLTYSETLNEDSEPDKSAFTLSETPYRVEIESVTVSGKTVKLATSFVIRGNLSTQFQLGYTAPNTSPLQQADGAKDAPDFYGELVVSSTPTTKPVFQSAAVDGATLTITFDLPLKNVAGASAFAVGGVTGVSVSSTSYSGKVVTLTLSSAVTASDSVTISYAKNGPPRIEARNNQDADSFTNKSVTNNTADPAPAFSSASVNASGDALTITVSKDLLTTTAGIPAASAFAISGGTAAITTVAVSGKTVTLTLSPKADEGDTITIAYTQPTSGGKLQSATGSHLVASWTAQSVTNNADGKPRPTSAAVSGTMLTITFDRALDTSSTPAGSTFTINGTSATASSVALSGSTATLTLSTAVAHNATITVGYTKPESGGLKRSSKAIFTDSFSTFAVTNNTPDPTPMFASASINAAGDKLTIAMSKNLLTTTAGTPAKGAFTLTGGSAAITTIAVSGKNVTLTLSPKADEGDTITIAYTKPTGANDGKLQSATGGHIVASWTAQSVVNNADGKPRPTSATVNGATLTINFDRALDTSSKPDASTFTVNGTSATASSVAIAASTATLTLSAAVAHNATITVSYAKPKTGGLKRSGKSIYTDSFTTLSVTNNTPDPTPTFSSASINAVGDKLTITMSKNLLTTTSGTPDKSAFTIAGGSAGLTAVVVSGKTITLTLSPKADEGDTITIAYTKPTGANAGKLQSATGGHVVATWTAQSVTNNADGKPRPQAASVNGTSLTIAFDRALDTASVPVKTDFAINGTTATISSVDISGSTATLALSASVAHDATITVDYTKPGSGGLKRSGKSIYTDSFNTFAVTNNTPDPTPTFSSASVNAAGDALAITMSKNLLTTTTGVPAASAFTITGGSTAITAVAVSGKKVTLTLSPKADEGDTITIAYTKPAGVGSKLQSQTGGHIVASWTAQPVTNNTDGKPRPQSASINGTTLTITFDRVLDTSSVPAKTNFTITGTSAIASSVAIAGSTATLTLSAFVAHDATITVSYAKSNTNALKRSDKAIYADSFNAFAVTNNSPAPPTLSSAVGNEQLITLTFSGELNDQSVPSHTAFSLGSNQPAVATVAIAEAIVNLNLSAPLSEGGIYSLTYTVPQDTPLVSSQGALLPGFTQPLTNNTDVAPTATSATGDGTTVTITFDQVLDSESEILTADFSITANPATTVANISRGNKSLSLTLSRVLSEDETASVAYTQPDENGIADTSGNRTASFTLSISNQTDTAPVPASGTVDQDEIIITLDQEVYNDPRFQLPAGYPTDHFSLTGTDATITFILVSNGGPGGNGKIVITLSDPVAEGAAITVKYSPTTGTIRIRDDDAGQNRAQINDHELINLTDYPPTIQSTELNATTLEVMFDQSLDPNSLPSPTTFALSNDGPTIGSISISNEVLTLTLATTAVEAAKYTLSYTPPESGGLSDLTGNAVVAFSQDVENTTDYAPYPITVKAEAEGDVMGADVVHLQFDQPIDQSGSIDHAWFRIDPQLTIRSADFELEGDRLLLELDTGTWVREGMVVTLTYMPPSTGGLKDGTGNRVIAFTEEVTNEVDVAPQVEKIVVNHRAMTIEFDQSLSEDEAHVPPTDCEELKERLENPDFECPTDPEIIWFVVEKSSSKEIDISSVDVNDSTVTLDLSERVAPTDDITVSYTPQSLEEERYNLRDTSDPANQVTKITQRPATNETAAAPLSATIDQSTPNEITISFDGDLGEETAVDFSAMEVMVATKAVTIASATSTGDTLTLNLSANIPECASVTFAYYASDGTWRDDRGKLIQTVRNFAVANLINSAWGLKCVESKLGHIILTFAEDRVPDKDGWELTANEREREITVEISDSTVTLTSTPSVCLGDKINISHTGSGGPHSHTRTISSAASCAVSAVADRTTLTVTFDQPLGDTLPTPADFTLIGSATIEAVTGVDGSVLTLQLSAPGLHVSEEARLSYTNSTSAGVTLPIAPFILDVTIDPAPPKLKSAIGFRSWISLEFDQPLLPRSIAASRFIPFVPNLDDIDVLSVDVSGVSVLLELSHDLPDDVDRFALVYLVMERGGLESLLGARVTESLFIVENLTETEPLAESAIANDQTITVTFDQQIKATDASPSDFSIAAGRRTIVADSLAWSPDGVVIELAERVTSLDAIRLIYAPATPGSVRDLSGIALKPFEFWVENRTPSPRTVQQKVDDAALRSSSGETTFERELVRAFATDDGIRAAAAPGDGWTTFARRGLTVLVDASSIGDSATRIYVQPLDQIASMMKHLEPVSSYCWNDATASGASAWWIGQTDLHGVPTDLSARVTVFGTSVDISPGSYCVLDLRSGEWRFPRWPKTFVGPSLVLKQTPLPNFRMPWLLSRSLRPR